MKFLVDECIGPSVANWLKTQGHEAYSIVQDSPGILDEEVLDRAVREELIIITDDKDFGELIFLRKLPHHGIILLRIEDETVDHKITILSEFFSSITQPEDLTSQFVVITNNSIRIRS